MRPFKTAWVAVMVSMLASAVCGEPIPYTNYSSGARTGPGATWEGFYVEGPWAGYTGPDHAPAPFWNVNTALTVEYVAAGPPTFDAELVGTIPFMGTARLQAHQEGDPDVITGTMVWSAHNTTVIDFNASRAIVDQDAGLIMLKWGQPFLPPDQPTETYTFVEETGVFLDDGIVPARDPNNPDNPSDSELFYSGWLFLPVLPGVDVNDPVQLQENILAAPPVGAFAAGVWTGQFTFDGALQAGDADQDLDFDQFDLIRVQQAAKYLTGQSATWGEGDWNGAPGGSPGNPPAGDGLFNQDDVVAALNADRYLKGAFAALTGQGEGDGKVSITYNPENGELGLEVAATELTSINIDSPAAIFTAEPAQNVGGSFDNDADGNIFKATFGGSLGTLSFGKVGQPGLNEEVVRNGVSAVDSLFGGGDLGVVELTYVPEPSTSVLLGCSLLGLLTRRYRRR